ncbi:MAG: VPS10 domain-containing protein [Blastocatellia bacterium]
MRRLILLLSISYLGATLGSPLAVGSQRGLDDLLRDGFQYRNLGPFRVGAWISDVAVPEAPLKSHLYTFYVAARSGGVWKTTNNGVTFEPVFDNQNVVSIGALAIAPSDENIVWVGTGDASCARSAYWGDGVYKSTDGAKTWRRMGLPESHHIARIVIHPANPDIVYVAAMGHLFSTNEERGVFKTTDGGKTWKKSLYVNDHTGAVDLVINRGEPNTLYAATYDCIRYPWRLQDGGPGTGIYKTTDGGAIWKRLEGGLPGGEIGRIGIDIYQKDPKTLYALVDNRNKRPAREEEIRLARERNLPLRERAVGGEVYRTDDAGATWRKVSAEGGDMSSKTGYAFNQLRVDQNNPDRLFITGANLSSSEDGGKTWTGAGQSQARPFRRAFGDFRTVWIDPQNSDRIIAGSDGGVYISYDGGKTCDHLNNLPLGEVYALTVDMDDPYNIYAGLQDHESWKGPSNGWSGSVGLADWVTVGTGDGMYNQVDPTDSRWLYNTQEFGRHARFDQKTRERKIIAPTRPQGQQMLRFNWVAPLRMSPHDPKTLYAGAQILFRSKDRGETWQEISPDLTTNDPAKISPPGAAIQHCTITTISESPAQAGVIWVGTDDGKAHMTRDAGARWNDVTKAIARAGGPEDAWVTRVFASSFDAGTAYVAKSRHRQDDFRPFLYKTSDFGATWTPIIGNLPARPINVVFEDNLKAGLLFVGNDMGVYVSLDAGEHWSALKGNMPVVAAHDLVVHPREGDLVVGTYGRGVWVTDIEPLREMNAALQSADAYFFAIEPKAQRREGALGNYRLYGDRLAVTPNEPNGLTLVYYLKEVVKEKVTLTVTDASGKTIRTLDGTTKAGLNRVVWTLGDAERQFGAGFRPPGAAQSVVSPGEYTVTLQAGEKRLTQKARVLAAQTP